MMGEATVLGQFLLIFRQVDRGRIIADGEARASRNEAVERGRLMGL